MHSYGIIIQIPNTVTGNVYAQVEEGGWFNGTYNRMDSGFISMVGIVGCTAALIICGNVFKRQREHMLERIETE